MKVLWVCTELLIPTCGKDSSALICYVETQSPSIKSSWLNSREYEWHKGVQSIIIPPLAEYIHCGRH